MIRSLLAAAISIFATSSHAEWQTGTNVDPLTDRKGIYAQTKSEKPTYTGEYMEFALACVEGLDRIVTTVGGVEALYETNIQIRLDKNQVRSSPISAPVLPNHYVIDLVDQHFLTQTFSAKMLYVRFDKSLKDGFFNLSDFDVASFITECKSLSN